MSDALFKEAAMSEIGVQSGSLVQFLRVAGYLHYHVKSFLSYIANQFR